MGLLSIIIDKTTIDIYNIAKYSLNSEEEQFGGSNISSMADWTLIILMILIRALLIWYAAPLLYNASIKPLFGLKQELLSPQALAIAALFDIML